MLIYNVVQALPSFVRVRGDEANHVYTIYIYGIARTSDTHLSLQHAWELRKVAFIYARATGWWVFKAQYTTIHGHSYPVLCPYVKIGNGNNHMHGCHCAYMGHQPCRVAYHSHKLFWSDRSVSIRGPAHENRSCYCKYKVTFTIIMFSSAIFFFFPLDSILLLLNRRTLGIVNK